MTIPWKQDCCEHKILVWNSGNRAGIVDFSYLILPFVGAVGTVLRTVTLSSQVLFPSKHGRPASEDNVNPQ